MNQSAVDEKQTNYLPEGSVLVCKDREFVIGRVLGEGGTGIVYAAVSPQSSLHYAIKEVRPAVGRYIRRSGVICPADMSADTDVAKLATVRGLLAEEVDISEKLRNHTVRVTHASLIYPREIRVAGEGSYEVTEPVGFALMENLGEKTVSLKDILDRPKLPPLYTSLCVMEQVLLALERVHEAGYIHGDIQLGNIMLADCDLENDNVGIGLLLDFGSARKLTEGKTEEVEKVRVYSTDGYRPPEIGGDGAVSLTAAADVYSATCLMLRFLLRPYRVQSCGISPSAPQALVMSEDAKRLGIDENLCKRVNKILEKGLHRRPAERYQNATEMRIAIQQLKRLCEKRVALLPPVPVQTASYVKGSRKTQIKEILRDLEHECVFLSGVGGIGKTQTAIQIAKEWSDSHMQGAFWTYFVPSEEHESMEETIMRMEIADYTYIPSSKRLTAEQCRAEEYGQRLDILRRHAGALLVVDNFDHPTMTIAKLQTEKSFADLTDRCGLKLLFTTRASVVGKPAWVVEALPVQQVLQLMRQYCPSGRVTDEQLVQLAREVDCHTLMCELMAKTLHESELRITPEKLLSALQNSGLSRMGGPDVLHKKDRSAIDDKLYCHLKALFDLSGLSDTARRVLCCASLLPMGGMDLELFRSGFDDDEDEARIKLVKSGWLNRTVDDLQTIHPLVRDVVIEELQPSAEECGAFLKVFEEVTKDGRAVYEVDQLSQMAEMFAMAAKRMGSPERMYVLYSGILQAGLGHYDAALSDYEQALAMAKSRERGTDVSEYVMLLNMMGTACADKGRYDEAMEYYQRAYELCKTGCDPEGPQIAECITNIGMTCYYLGQYDVAVQWQTDARKCLERAGLDDTVLYKTVLSNLAVVQLEIGRFREAKDNLLLAMQAADEIFGHHMLRVRMYNNLARCCSELDERQEAIAHYLTAVKLCEESGQTEHPNFGAVCLNLGVAYLDEQNVGEALGYLERAREIYEQHDEVHPTLGSVYTACGHAYSTKQEYSTALVYYKKGLTVRRKTLPADHPKLLESLVHVGKFSLVIEDYDAAIQILNEALTGSKTHFGYRHPKTPETLDFLGLCYHMKKDYRRALHYYRSALTLRKLLFRGDVLGIAQCYYNIGGASHYLGKYRKALKNHQKALRLREQLLPAGHPLILESRRQIDYAEAACGKR